MNEDIHLITEIDKRSPIAEAYRSIRTNLQFAGAGKELKYISFTSATPREGKSTTISNVAITCTGQRILDTKSQKLDVKKLNK
jgi:Mrp family chromosome partitioning ATPase